MQLVLLIGLPGSGKSTFYREHFAATHLRVSKDAMRGKRNRDRKQRGLMEEAELVCKSVVLDNTHPSVQARAPWIAWARERGWSVHGYYFSSRVVDCYSRNAARPPDERVPDVGFYAIVGALKLPSYSEHFDRLFYVRQVDGKFAVEEWRDDEEQPL